MARLGLDYDAVKRARPDIVYCSISGYGQTGPLAGEPAYDGTIQAISGMMSNNGHPETGPTRAGFLPVDVPTAFLAAYAISAALFRRGQTGRGQFIDLAMIDTAILMQLSVFSRVFTDGSGGGLIGNRSTAGVLTADAFPCSDGYIAVSAVTRPQGRIVLELAGLDPGLWDDFDPDNPDSPALAGGCGHRLRRLPHAADEGMGRTVCARPGSRPPACSTLQSRRRTRPDGAPRRVPGRPGRAPRGPAHHRRRLHSERGRPGNPRRGIRDRRGYRSCAGGFRLLRRRGRGSARSRRYPGR